MSEMVLVKSRTVYICAAIMVGILDSLDGSVGAKNLSPYEKSLLGKKNFRPYCEI